MTEKRGRITFVGTGIAGAGQCTQLAKSEIAHADAVFTIIPNPVTMAWLRELNANVTCLRRHYAEGRDRRITYQAMVDEMMAALYDGKRVVGAFYGHPGVFACVGHWTIARARKEGFEARMEPGISAEDCLVADLGLDIGDHGCLSYEATQFMIFDRPVDPGALLILWQIGIAGVCDYGQFATTRDNLQILVDLLAESYPRDHEVIVYRAATLPPVERPRIDRMPLHKLPDAALDSGCTLVIPPCRAARPRDAIRARLGYDRQRAMAGDA